jgi:hypothetical protein
LGAATKKFTQATQKLSVNRGKREDLFSRGQFAGCGWGFIKKPATTSTIKVNKFCKLVN